jgi:hypothetical protein
MLTISDQPVNQNFSAIAPSTFDDQKVVPTADDWQTVPCLRAFKQVQLRMDCALQASVLRAGIAFNRLVIESLIWLLSVETLP